MKLTGSARQGFIGEWKANKRTAEIPQVGRLSATNSRGHWCFEWRMWSSCDSSFKATPAANLLPSSAHTHTTHMHTLTLVVNWHQGFSWRVSKSKLIAERQTIGWIGWWSMATRAESNLIRHSHAVPTDTFLVSRQTDNSIHCIFANQRHCTHQLARCSLAKRQLTRPCVFARNFLQNWLTIRPLLVVCSTQRHETK